jgi:hypothetical protein
MCMIETAAVDGVNLPTDKNYFSPDTKLEVITDSEHILYTCILAFFIRELQCSWF